MAMVVVDDSCLKQADSLAHSPNQVAWSECRRPLAAALHSPNEPSELSQWPCGHDDSTINIVVIVIIILIIYYYRWESITSRRRSYLAVTWPRCRGPCACSVTRPPSPRRGLDSIASSIYSSPSVPSSTGLSQLRCLCLLWQFYRCDSGCVAQCRICMQSGGCRFESRPGLLRTKVYSAFHPSGLGIITIIVVISIFNLPK